MNIKGFRPSIVSVPHAESAPLMARLKSRARWLDECRAAQKRADDEAARQRAEHERRLDKARADAFDAMCRRPLPDNVRPIGGAR